MMASESPGILTTTLSTAIWNRDLADLRYQRLQCAPCIVNQSSLVAHVTPGPPSAAAAEAALCGAAAPAEPGPQPPERRSGRLGRRSGHPRSAGACDFSRKELTGAKFAAAGAAAAAAAADINETQERVILRDKN